MKHLLWIQFILLLAALKGLRALPTRDLSDDDWNTLLELIGRSKNLPSNYNEYYESFTLTPIIIKMDVDDNFNKKKDLIELSKPKFNRKDVTVSFEEAPQETSVWTSVKSFFTNDLNSFVQEVADNYNPVPPIVSAIDNVKRSDIWVDVNVFFTKGYNRLAKYWEGAINDIKTAIKN